MQELSEMGQYSDDFSLPQEFQPSSFYEIETELSSPLRLNFPDDNSTFKSPSCCQDIKKANRRKAITKVDFNTKKVIKQIRNRMAAQKSRDKKKQEIENLKGEVERLKQENEDLKHQIQATQMQIEVTKTQSTEHTRTHPIPLYKILLITLLVAYLCLKDADGVGKFLEENITKYGFSKKEQLSSTQRKRREYIERNSKLRAHTWNMFKP